MTNQNYLRPLIRFLGGRIFLFSYNYTSVLYHLNSAANCLFSFGGKAVEPLTDFLNFGFAVLVQIALIFLRAARENILQILNVVNFLQALDKQRVKLLRRISGSVISVC